VEEKWYQKPLRIGAIQYEQGEENYKKVPAILEEAGFNTEQLLHVTATDVWGLYKDEEHREKLQKYITDCEKRNIKIILYENAHIDFYEQYEKHPDWAQRGADGKPAMGYDTFVFMCVNTSWRESFFESIRLALKHQNIQGIFLDGPLFVGGGCHCEACQKLFLEQFGHPINQASKKELAQFKEKHIARFIRDVREVINESGKECLLYCNTGVLSENVTGADVDTVYDYVDMLGSEGGFIFYGDPNRTSLWKASRVGKYLESKAYGKPYVIFDAGNHQPWARYMLTEDENTLLYASVVAQGGNVWYGIHGSIADYQTPGGKAALSFDRWMADNDAYYTHTNRCSDLALVWTKNTVTSFHEGVDKSDFTVEERNQSQNDYGPHQSEFDGFYDMLTRTHCQFSVVDEKNLEKDDLSRYQAIILPNAICLSQTVRDKIRNYVQNGGQLITTLASGLCNEDGSKNSDAEWLKMCGIEQINAIVGHNAGCGYLRVEDDSLLDGMAARITAGFSKNMLDCTYTKDAENIASAYMGMKGRYSKFPDETAPAAVLNHYGEGRVYYISGGIGQTYQEFGVTDMKYFIRNILNQCVCDSVKVENLFESVEVALREQEDRKLLHFVNYTGQMRRPIEHVIPCENVKVSMACSRKAVRVHSVYNKEELAFTQKNGQIEFTLPRLGVYELVAVELE
jgi:hypothetical protein